MTDADKLERIRSIVADHDAYGLSRHHEMVLDITDVLFSKSGAPVTEAGAVDPPVVLLDLFDALKRSLEGEKG
jgi:hypothetical protein